MRKHKHKKKHGRRNTAGGGGAARRMMARLPRPRNKAAPPPDWKTLLAAIAGGAGGAALGGLIVNQEILSPAEVGLVMAAAGAGVAYFADGNARIVGSSVAAAGAGQLALTWMAKRAIEGKVRVEAPAPAAVATAPQLPAPAPTRKAAGGGGAVLDLFRDAAQELDMLEEDEVRYGVRDPDVVELYDLENADAAA